ncbi:protein HEXIM1 [Nematostella vectensis]|uniref:protein HEXIM1 n=1 Tax=Nematostella vectensis TaxID=45351 RepID=UPI00138FC780|nr:protein HEXIM1 [Nematostella vectensis]
MTEEPDPSSITEVDQSTMDGNEGDDERDGDERTSEHSGTEMPEKNYTSDQVTANHDKKEDSSDRFDKSGVKPMPISKKHRRGSRRCRKKKYKPYTKMTWDEKKARLELDAKKATKMREQYMHEKGRPAAPYNTTQFLMDEHDQEEPDLGAHSHMQSDGEDDTSNSTGRPRLQSQSMDDSDLEDYNESPEDEIYEQQFFEKDFTEAYEQVHAESLYSMNKDALVRECMCLEERVETLERQMREKDRCKNGLVRQTSLEELALKLNSESSSGNSDDNSSTRANEDVLSSLQSELNRLRSENERLRLENTNLTKTVPTNV